jgi:hypothetical protein
LFDKSASDHYFSVTKQKNKRKNQMYNKTTMEISICQAENGFSLDELVKKKWQILMKIRLSPIF